MDKKMLAASLLSIGLASIPTQGILASETLMNRVQVQQQQTIKVSGIVSDAEGPIIGASIVEQGTKSNGTVSDLDGKFTLSVKPGATLVISYMGYKKVEVRAEAGKLIQVKMVQDSEALGEVVVVGFGTQKKVNLTGAVDVIDNKQLSERPVANAVQALQGAAPGLEISQSSGSVESRPSINVRGATTIGATSGDPLILIDGMEGDLNAIN
ncbi:MAG TPA: SusC/RagA family protein, partial [Prevotella sp.]|nr:SusC/RagA family protein [Candidatus Segatella violae]